MQDHRNGDERPSGVTTKLPDMRTSGSDENMPSVHGQNEARDSRTQTDAHPKKKRKVNHGQSELPH